ncbi:MAG TPA: sialidase family protein [Propionibacteriaceae bacterium]|nr:sialidase family protein [Propionibacteriaceae bacterium]
MELLLQRARCARRRPLTSARRVACLLTLALLAAVVPPSAEAAAPGICTSTPFRNNVSKRVVYRIPAMVITPSGTLVAFAERRRSTHPSSDISDTEIVVVRSTDRGCRWSAPRMVADRGKGTVGNPAPVVDTTTGDILLFTIHRPPGGTTGHGFHMQRSTDDGRTFTPYGKAGKDLHGMPRWSGGLTGPGHAIQLRSPRSPHRGRIVVPMGYKDGNRYGAYAVVSDDHGRTWKVGYKQTGNDGRIEGTVAELPDGRLWISYRNRNVRSPIGTGRISAWSTNGGDSLSGPFKRAGLPIVSVQGSSLALGGRHAGTLLLSSPSGKDPTRRQRMAIFVSRGATVGKRWSRPYRVQRDSRPASYSDLVQIDSTRVGVLYETGQTSWHERIDYRSLRIADILAVS